jgi:hypothetical protein
LIPPPRIVCIPSRDAAFTAEARRLARQIPAHLRPAAALVWFTTQLRRGYPSATVREQSDLARSGKDEVTWYATLHDERFRIDLEVHVPLPPTLAFDIYVGRVAEWQRAVELRPRRLVPGLVGSEYDAVYTFLGRRYLGVFRILDADPPRTVSLEAAGSGIAVTYTATFEGDPAGTVVHIKGDYSLPDHLLARVADRLGLERAISRDIERANQAYRALCELVSRSPD